MNVIKFRLTGTRPMLMHADTGANPLHPHTKAHKELTGKRKKTDEDHEAIAKSEFLLGMYYDEDIGPYMPGINVESCLVAGGKLSKLGTALKRAVTVVEDMCPLEYDGPSTPDKLWEAGFYDCRSVKVTTSRLMRYRPMFRKWAVECTVAYTPEGINKEDIIKAMRDAGMMIGLGDFRPRFGRFDVEVIS